MGRSILPGLILGIIFIAALILIPFMLVWCLNTLGIASASYGVIEWIAAAILASFLLAGE